MQNTCNILNISAPAITDYASQDVLDILNRIDNAKLQPKKREEEQKEFDYKQTIEDICHQIESPTEIESKELIVGIQRFSAVKRQNTKSCQEIELVNYINRKIKEHNMDAKFTIETVDNYSIKEGYQNNTNWIKEFKRVIKMLATYICCHECPIFVFKDVSRMGRQQDENMYNCIKYISELFKKNAKIWIQDWDLQQHIIDGQIEDKGVDDVINTLNIFSRIEYKSIVNRTEFGRYMNQMTPNMDSEGTEKTYIDPKTQTICHSPRNINDKQEEIIANKTESVIDNIVQSFKNDNKLLVIAFNIVMERALYR